MSDEIQMEQYSEPCDMTRLSLDMSLMDYDGCGLVDADQIQFIGESPKCEFRDTDEIYDLEYLMNNDPSIAHEQNCNNQIVFKFDSVDLAAKQKDKSSDKMGQKSVTPWAQSGNSEPKPEHQKCTQDEVATQPDSPIKIKKKVGRKPLNIGLTKRKDVVFKTVLRKVRNFIRNSLNEITRYQAKKSRRDYSFYYECLTECVSKVLGLPATDKIIFLVGSLACPKDMATFISKDPYQTYPKSKIEKCQGIHTALYQFNHKRYQKEILKNSDMCRIVLAYFNHDDYEPAWNDDKIVGDMIVADCNSNLL